MRHCMSGSCILRVTRAQSSIFQTPTFRATLKSAQHPLYAWKVRVGNRLPVWCQHLLFLSLYPDSRAKPSSFLY
jgi:hypothetical protein